METNKAVPNSDTNVPKETQKSVPNDDITVTPSLIAPWKRELFDEIMLDVSETSQLKQNAVIDGYHNAGQHLAFDVNEKYLTERNPDRLIAKRRTMTDEEIREWADYFVLGYIGRVRIEEERRRS